MAQDGGFFIGGKWTNPLDRKRLETINSATGEVLATFPQVTKEDANVGTGSPASLRDSPDPLHPVEVRVEAEGFPDSEGRHEPDRVGVREREGPVVPQVLLQDLGQGLRVEELDSAVVLHEFADQRRRLSPLASPEDRRRLRHERVGHDDVSPQPGPEAAGIRVPSILRVRQRDEEGRSRPGSQFAPREPLLVSGRVAAHREDCRDVVHGSPLARPHDRLPAVCGPL